MVEIATTNLSRYFDYDIEKRIIVDIGNEPLFTYGPKGSFYESGVMLLLLYRKWSEVYFIMAGKLQRINIGVVISEE